MRLAIAQPRAGTPFLRSLPPARHVPLAARRGCRVRGPWHRPGLKAPLTISAMDRGGPTSASQQQPSGWQTFWGVVDVGAWLGAMGAAAAFLITQEAMLAAAPVALPILALYASKQRERLAAEASQAELSQRSQQLLERVAQLARGAAGEAAATEIARAVELQQQANTASAGVLKSLDAKLGTVEGSVLSTGSTTREALKESAAAQGRLAQETITRLEALATAVRRDVSAELQRSGADEVAVLSRVEARLASLEGSIRSLEASQSEGLRRITSSVSSALMDAEDSLEAVVRAEASRSLEPLRRLPQLIAQAMPVTPEVVGGPTPMAGLSEEALRELLAEQLGAATRTILQRQADLLAELRQVPALVAPQQWNQLGTKLLGLDTDIKQLLAAQEVLAAAAVAAPAPAAPAAADAAELAAQLAALRGDVAALGASLERLTLVAMGPTASERPSSGGGLAAGTRRAVWEGSELEEASGSDDEGVFLAAAITQQQQQQQQQLGEALELLRVLAGRLEGLGQQVADAVAQQAQQARQGAIASPQQQQVPETAAAVEGAATAPTAAPMPSAAADLEEREAAYRRMQALLNSSSSSAARQPAADGEQPQQQQQPQATAAAAATAGSSGEGASLPEGAQPSQVGTVERAGASSNGAAPGPTEQPEPQQQPQQPAVPIREWLSGRAPGAGEVGASTQQQQQEQQRDLTATGAALSGAGAWPAAAAGPDLGSTSPTPGYGSTGASPGASPFIQSTIAYGAALGGVYEEEEQGLAAASPAEAMQQGAAGPQSAVPAADAAAPAPPAAAPGLAPQEQAQRAQQAQQQPEPSWEAPAAAAAAAAAAAGSVEPEGSGQPAAWDAAAAAAGPAAPSVQATQLMQAPQEAAPSLAPADALWSSLLALAPEVVFQRGRQRLQEGRELTITPGGDLGLADSLLYEAELCFEAALEQQPDNVKAWGNLGNALMAHGRLKLQMAGLLRAQRAAAEGVADAADAAWGSTAEERLAREARDLLVMAGRKYAKVLELDPSDTRALINWGRVIGLRADAARQAGDLQEAARLFDNAVDKFDGVLDLDAQNTQALRLGGMALLDAATCTVETDRKQAKQLFKDAEGYLESAAASDPLDTLSAQKLADCKAWLEYLRGARYAS